jgi:hypothetical protein
LVVLLPAFGQSGGSYDLTWSTVDGGGGSSSGGSYAVNGTAGQPDARNQPEPMVGGDYSVTGGFWVIPACSAIPGDYDGDCDVDQADYRSWEACASGPEVPYTGDCGDTDFDNDLDTDQEDFSVFQGCYSGKDNPADPQCAG